MWLVRIFLVRILIFLYYYGHTPTLKTEIYWAEISLSLLYSLL